MDDGRAPSGQALVASDEAPVGLHPTGFDPSRLLHLAELCAEETGPDRELDAACFCATRDARVWGDIAFRLPMDRWGDRFDDGWRCGKGLEDKWPNPLPRLTGDLEAARLLLDPKALWAVGRMEDGPFARVLWPMSDGSFVGGYAEAYASTSPLALCAAALRAQANAIATEARRAETTGSVEDEGAGPKDIAQ